MEILDKNDIAQYKKFLETNKNSHLLQSPEWGEIKENWNWEAVVERDGDGNIIGGLSVLIRKIPCLPISVLYAPRGPVCDLEDTAVLKSLFDGAKMIAKRYHGCVFMLEPNMAAENTKFQAVMESLGFCAKPCGENFDGIQKCTVFRLNITGKTEEEVMAQFTSKTRYNIRVAQKHHVEVIVRDKSYLDEFVFLMRQTGSRDGFVIRSKAYFERILDLLGSHARLYISYYEGQPLSGAIAVQYGDKAWYLYGASSDRCRHTMPNYLMQWEMIKWAIETGCSIYDFRGASAEENSPLHGLYRFKKGFGGDYTELIGEYDYILNRPAFKLFELGVKLLNGFNAFRLKLPRKPRVVLCPEEQTNQYRIPKEEL